MSTDRVPSSSQRVETDAVRRRHSQAGATATRSLVHVVLLGCPVDDPMISQALIGAADSARQHRLDLVLVPNQVEDRKETSAAIVLASPTSAAHISAAQATGLPVVCMGRRDCDGPDVPLASNDHRGGASAAVKLLRQHGHRRIALVCGPDTARHWRDRRAAWHQVLTADGLAADLDCEITDDANARAAFIAAWNGGLRATAIFAANDHVAVGVYAAAEHLGLRIPADLSVVGFDDLDLAARMVPPLTTIQVAKQGLGSAAIEMVVQMLAGETPRDRRLPTRLIQRASVAPPRAV